MLKIWVDADEEALKTTVHKVLGALDVPFTVTKFVEGDDLPWTEPGDIVMAMGKGPVDRLRKTGLIHKGLSISSLRGKTYAQKVLLPPDDHGYVHWMVAQSPGMIWIDAKQLPEIRWDLRLAYRFAKTGTLHPPLGKYGWVKTFDGVLAYIDQKFEKTGKPVQVSIDLETMGLDPYTPGKEILTISMTPEAGYADVLNTANLSGEELKYVVAQIRQILNSEKVVVVGANLKFDLKWIREKWGITCSNFKFDTLIVGSLINENRSNSLNAHAKEYTPLGGYDDCVAVGTRVCTDDLRWVPVESIKPGDGLLGFDEQPQPGKRHRMALSKAVSTKTLTKPGVEVVFDNGTMIRCSDDHGFVAHVRGVGNGPFGWVRAKDLKPGRRVLVVAPVETESPSREAGYLAGLYDGEGYVSKAKAGLVSGISQQPGAVWDRYRAGMEALGFGGFYSHQKNGDNVHTSKHSGWPTLRLLQVLRPQRLLNKTPYVGRCVPSGAPKVHVVSVTPIGPLEVVSLQTTTHTFVAEGIASHNSFNQKHDKAHMEKALVEDPDGFVTYAGGDTDAALQVAHEQFSELAQLPEVKRFYVKLLHPAARAFESIEHRGMIVDLHKYKELENDLTLAQLSAEKLALSMIPPRLKLKHEDKGVSLTRKALLEDFLFGPAGLGLKPLMTTEKSDAPSTAKAHLMMFMDHPEAGPFIQAYNDWNGSQKMLSTYVHGFLKHLRPDGRFHPTYMLFAGSAYESKGDDDGGTNTGRLSCVDPAMQTIPKHTKWAKQLRKCFPAPPGMVFWEADFSQGELRITADVADEPQMLSAYAQGLDLHAVTGAQLAGYELDEFLALGQFPEGSPEEALFAKFRQQAKPANFGLLYGMGAEGFQEFARIAYKLKLTLAEATQIRDQFFVLYGGLPKWHSTYKNFAKQNGFVMSPLGRMRNLPLIRSKNGQARSKAERQAVNAPIQGCLSDMNLWSSAILEQNWGGEGPDQLWVAGSTHDAIYGYCPEHNAKEVWLPRIVEVMSTLPLNEVFGWQPKIPMPADIAVGPSLGELAKFKIAA